MSKKTYFISDLHLGAKYMADRGCYERCMYEAINSPFAPGAAERLAQTAVTMLQAAAMSK